MTAGRIGVGRQLIVPYSTQPADHPRCRGLGSPRLADRLRPHVVVLTGPGGQSVRTPFELIMFEFRDERCGRYYPGDPASATCGLDVRLPNGILTIYGYLRSDLEPGTYRFGVRIFDESGLSSSCGLPGRPNNHDLPAGALTVTVTED